LTHRATAYPELVAVFDAMRRLLPGESLVVPNTSAEQDAYGRRERYKRVAGRAHALWGSGCYSVGEQGPTGFRVVRKPGCG